MACTDRLKRAGVSASLRKGFWQLTAAGKQFAKDHAGPLPEDEFAFRAPRGSAMADDLNTDLLAGQNVSHYRVIAADRSRRHGRRLSRTRRVTRS